MSDASLVFNEQVSKMHDDEGSQLEHFDYSKAVVGRQRIGYLARIIAEFG
jgi:hypothetical protein